jgi:branched-chain amino acid transport system substrate-binding protein
MGMHRGVPGIRAADVKRSLIAACASLALLVVACGTREVPLSQFQGSGISAAGGPAVSPTAAPAAQQTSVATGSSVSLTGAPEPGRPVGAGPKGGSAASCRGGATDVGVTATSVKVGAVIALTGPLPGQFNPARDAVDSYFKMINEQEGGVCGRKIQFVARDDNGDTTNNRRQALRLIKEDKVFALVGSVSQADGGMVEVVCNKPFPDIGFQLDWNHGACRNAFSVPGQVQRRLAVEGGPGDYLNRTNGIKHISLFWLRDSEVSVLAAWSIEAGQMKVNRDIDVCYEQETSVFETGFDQFVLNMRDKCPAETTAIYTTMENTSNIRLAKAMQAQGYKPKVYSPTLTSYIPSYITQADGSTEGNFIAVPQLPFERCAQKNDLPVPPCSHPELQRFVAALGRYHPGASSGTFGAPGWGMAGLFVESLRKCGANLTRKCVMNFFNTTGAFDANGFLAGTRPGDHKPLHSFLLIQVKGDRFVEVPPTPGTPRPFWFETPIFDWFDWYCHNKGRFIDTGTKDRFISCS